MNQASIELLALARRIATVYAQGATTRAIIVMGSAAEGHADFYSDLEAHYPNELAQAMVAHYLNFVPVWSKPERFLDRDGALWMHQILVEADDRYHPNSTTTRDASTRMEAVITLGQEKPLHDPNL